ncbi:MAG: hypothetical protein U0166_19985 [Acidobacteriota bacterium]
MSRWRLVVMVAATACYIPLMLLADSWDPVRQAVLALATAGFLYWLVRFGRVPGVQVTWAILLASAGEIGASVLWGIYRYRYAAIPFYVPFGHGIFYALALRTSVEEALRRHARAIVRTVVIAGSVYGAMSLVLLHDVTGLLWWIGAALLMTRSESGLLMAACCVYTVALEWTGTTIGNWRWSSVVPYLGIPSANPPCGVGFVYCLVDISTVAICRSGAMTRLVDRLRYADERLCGSRGRHGITSVGLALRDLVGAFASVRGDARAEGATRS